MNKARLRLSSYLAPAFLILVFLILAFGPGSTLDKFNMICFGI